MKKRSFGEHAADPVDFASEGDLSRLRRAGRWLGRIVGRGDSQGGDLLMSTASSERITQEKIDRAEAIARAEEEQLYRKVRVPEITAGFGDLEPYEFDPYPQEPSDDEIQDGSVAEAAMAFDNPWVDDVPPLYVERVQV